MNADEMAEQYVNCVQLLHQIVRDFIKRVGLPWREYEELFSRAHLYFVLAAQSYDGESSKFSTWLVIQVKGRLMKQLQLDMREWNAIKYRYMDWHDEDDNHDLCWQPYAHDRRFGEIVNRNSLDRDGRLLLRLVQRKKLDLGLLGKNHKTALRYLYTYLRHERGWSRVRIYRCFKDLEKLLE